MPMMDMLDVIHYFFETDNLCEKEEGEAKRSLRQAIYHDLYQREYTWGSQVASADEWGTHVASSTPERHYIDKRAANGSSLPAALPVGGNQMTHKPYIPPTPMNADAALPFGNVLDAPLG